LTERITTLANGLTVAVDSMSTTRSVSVGVWVGVGSRDEPSDLAGVSHFLEHLLFKGSHALDARGISRRVDRVGGDINAYTSREHTAYYCRMPARHALDAVDLLGEVVLRPALRPEDVESERRVILEELAMDDDVPDDIAHREFHEAVFTGHPLGRDPGGRRETVTALTVDEIAGFHRDEYTAERMVLAVAGAVDTDEIVEQAERVFGDARCGSGQPIRTAPSTMGEDRFLVDDTEQTHLVIGGRSLPRTHPDREALDIVNHVLGGGLSSRLFDEIRERRGLVYHVQSGLAAHADAGSWLVYAGSHPERAAEVRSLIEDEIDRMAARGPTEEEVEIAKGYLVGAYELGLEDSGTRMSRLGGMLTMLGGLIDVDEQIRRWVNTDADSIARVADAVLGGRRIAVTLGPV
jgi:predicted Zn-dependent peptidase